MRSATRDDLRAAQEANKQLLSQQFEQISKLNEEIAAANHSVSILEAHTSVLEDRLGKDVKLLAGQAAKLSDLIAQRDQLAETVSAQQAQIGGLVAKKLEDARNLTERAKRIDLLTRRYEDAKEEVRLLAAARAEHFQHLEGMTARCEELTSELKQLHDRSQAMANNAQSQEQYNADVIRNLRFQIDAIYKSRSWRITEPLRRLITKWRVRRGPARPVLKTLTLNEPLGRLSEDVQVIERSGLFDPTFYAGRQEADALGISSIQHYLLKGEAAGLMPSPKFDPRSYRKANSAGATEANLFLHYIRNGALESRAGHGIVAENQEINWADAELIARSYLFDESFYQGHAEAIALQLSPSEHYVTRGEAAGLAPSSLFDPNFYSERNPDVRAGGGNLLAHYIRHGRSEGRSGVSAASELQYDNKRFQSDRDTVIIAIHEATRTGAPVLGWNIIGELVKRYNVVALLKKGGPLEAAISGLATATVSLPENFVIQEAETAALARLLVLHYNPRYMIANSVETRHFVGAMENMGVPTVALVHEFSGTVKPYGALHGLFESASEIVFSAQLVADAAVEDYRVLGARSPRVIPQGPSKLPSGTVISRLDGEGNISQLPDHTSFLVIGVGTITPRKGVEFFIGAAAAVARRSNLKITFAWIGQYYSFDEPYFEALKEQLRRSGLGKSFIFINELENLDAVYDRACILFLSSRLDPLPNVGIDAAVRGIPLVCFDQASGMAEILAADRRTSELVVPYADSSAAADKIIQLVEDSSARLAAGRAMQAIASEHFDMVRYVSQLDTLGLNARQAKAQVQRDYEVIERYQAFNADLYLGVHGLRGQRRPPLLEYLDASRREVPRDRPWTGMLSRRPREGFNPLVYAAEAPDYDERGEDPLAHYARMGFPEGRWKHHVIRPSSPMREGPCELRVALHGHFHYPELFADLVGRLGRNRAEVALFLTTSSAEKAVMLKDEISRLGVQGANVKVVPNRGRDIGPFLTEVFQAELRGYDIIGHLHGKRSLHVPSEVGQRWRDHLWDNLIGGDHPMMDVVLAAFAANPKLGLVFPEDPHLNGWNDNREIAERLAFRMGIRDPLPNHFDFPQGTMFWARPEAIGPLLRLGLEWDDYPNEPVAIDGTILHALERLLPFSAAEAGYHLAVTYVGASLR